MLRSIPRKIMKNSATMLVPQTVDKYGAVVSTSYSLSKVHIQPTHSVVKTRDNKEVSLKAVLFYDPRVSTPSVDFNTLQSDSDTRNAQIKIIYGGLTYTVESVDLVPDDEGSLHHVELGLV